MRIKPLRTGDRDSAAALDGIGSQAVGIKMPDHVPMITQERAYTSPIWYTPEK